MATTQEILENSISPTIGWKDWQSVQSYTDVIVPYAEFPSSYLPTSNFWARTFFIGCQIPFYIGDASLGYAQLAAPLGLAGVTYYASAVEESMLNTINALKGKVFGISPIGNKPMSVGFCLGENYHEFTYFYLEVFGGFNSSVSATLYPDIFQRSRLKRIYAEHGVIDGVITTQEKDEKKFFVTIGLHDKMSTELKDLFSKIKGNIKIYDPETTRSYSINSINENWEIEINATEKTLPKINSFFTLSDVWCIEDPLFMSGFWEKNEKSNLERENKSGFDLPLTLTNYPYEEIQFTGAYVFKSNNKVVSVNSSTPLKTVVDGEWYWIKFDNIESEIYGDTADRWKINVNYVEELDVTTTTTTPIEGATTTTTTTLAGSIGSKEKYVKFKTGSMSDYNEWVKNEDITYVRLELNKGGSSRRQNWHSPILTNCWVKQNENHFKIIGQPNGNVVDISKKDVINKNSIFTASKASIFNQYAWMVNEHYVGDEGSTLTGIFASDIKSASYNTQDNTTTVTMSTIPIINGTVSIAPYMYQPDYLCNETKVCGNYINRYVMDATSDEIVSAKMKKCYVKRQNWNLISYNREKSFPIISISGLEEGLKLAVADGKQTNTIKFEEGGVLLTLKVSGDASKETKSFITFDEPYVLSFQVDPNVAIFNATRGSISGNGISQTVCLDAEFRSSPIKQFVGKDTLMGVCGGHLWGLSEYEQKEYPDNYDYSFSVERGKRSPCVASLYNNLSTEDGIAYRDPYSNKMTIRKGFLDFKDTPKKMEVTIGSSIRKSVGSFPVSIDEKLRLKAIEFILPTGKEDDKSQTLMFTAKNNTDYWGNLVRGFGQIKLNGVTDPKKSYDFINYKTSPVFVFKNIANKCLYKYNTVHIGLDSDDSPVDVVGDTKPTDVAAEYVNDNQTLEDFYGFDWMKFGDGEDIIVYGVPDEVFTLNGAEVNSKLWQTGESIFIIGSATEGITWGCPIFKENYTNSLMIMPNCELMSSAYDSLSNMLYIFARCIDDKTNNKYIGMLAINVFSLTDNLQRCTYKDISKRGFDIRPPNLDPESKISFTTKATLEDITKNLNVPSNTEEETKKYDFFNKILGNSATGCQISIGNADTITTISTFILKGGVICMLYDSDFGVRMAFSRDNLNWIRTPYIIAKEAHSPTFVDDEVIAYITNDGRIEAKVDIQNLLLQIISTNDYAGNTDENYEIEATQKELDSAKVIIATGQSGAQKMAGYKTKQGVYKLFFYYTDTSFSTDSKNSGKSSTGVVGCAESTDKLNWHIADNF
jgi:hypothetical protein